MSRLRRYLDHIEPHFLDGGRYQRFYAVFEMIDTFLYATAVKTRQAPHVRDGLDLKRLMTYVIVALIPVLLWSWYNTGYQSALAIAHSGGELSGWRGTLLAALGIAPARDSFFANMCVGLLYFLPIYLTTLIAGGLWEVLFATVRKHEVNEGFLVTSMLYTLTMPPDMPLWMVALGISFGIVLGKEVFGGTGKNFLNPALTGRAFLYFAYPAYISGDQVWVAVDGYSHATGLSLAASGGIDTLTAAGQSWLDSFLGFIPGSLGETSTLAILLGAAFLMYTRVASWRVILGVFIGMVATSLLFNFSDSSNPMMAMPWYWHLVLGGFAFGMVFMATDPVSAAMTNTGRWIYGALIGFMTVLIRVANPAFPEGIMLAILFANIFAPLIDYGVMQLNIRRRNKRHANI